MRICLLFSCPTIVDQPGNFNIVIPENSEITKFAWVVESANGARIDIVSGCPGWCDSLEYGKTTELTLEVDF